MFAEAIKATAKVAFFYGYLATKNGGRYRT